jgi:hypothetical protein
VAIGCNDLMQCFFGIDRNISVGDVCVQRTGFRNSSWLAWIVTGVGLGNGDDSP